MNPGILTPPTQFATMPRGLLGRPTSVPMPRLLSGYDPDAERYLNAVELADRAPADPIVRRAVTDFVVGCKSDGLWGSFRQCGIMIGARTLAGAIVPLVGGTVTNQNFVSADYNARTGLIGNGVNKQLVTPLAGDAVPQDDVHLSVFITTLNSIGGERFYINGGGAVGSQTHIATTRVRLRDANANFFAPGLGFVAASRSSSSSFFRRNLGTTSAATVGTGSSPPASLAFSVFVGSVNARMAFYSIGTSVSSLAMLDARVSELCAVIGAATA